MIEKANLEVFAETLLELARKDKDIMDVSIAINLDVKSAYNLSLIYWAKNTNSINDIKYLLKENKSTFYT